MRKVLPLLLLAGCPSVRPPPPEAPDPAQLAPPDCHPDDLDGLLHCVEPERLHAALAELARPRPPGSAGHAAAQERCRTRLTELGYDVRVDAYEGGTNIVGRREGFKTPGQVLAIGAHYDHLPDCPGADDNATGVAALLEVARVAAKARFDRTIEVACWDGGEAEQSGSAAYATTLEPETFRGAIVLESIGYADDAEGTQTIPERFDTVFPDQALEMLDHGDRGDFLTVVTDTKTEAWANRIQAHSKGAIELHAYVLLVTDAVKAKAKKDDLYRSDHLSFWDAELPAMLLTDTGGFRNPNHHCREGRVDAPEHLSRPFFEKTTAVALAALVEGAGLRREVGPIR